MGTSTPRPTFKCAIPSPPHPPHRFTAPLSLTQRMLRANVMLRELDLSHNNMSSEAGESRLATPRLA